LAQLRTLPNTSLPPASERLIEINFYKTRSVRYGYFIQSYVPGGSKNSSLNIWQYFAVHVTVGGLVTTAAGLVSQERSVADQSITHE